MNQIGKVTQGTLRDLFRASRIRQKCTLFIPFRGPKIGAHHKMARNKHTPEQVINKLREAEVAIAEGSTVAEAARRIGVTEQTFYRWRSEYGGLRLDQARRLKRLELENSRLKRAVADLTLDNQILREASEGKF